MPADKRIGPLRATDVLLLVAVFVAAFAYGAIVSLLVTASDPRSLASLSASAEVTAVLSGAAAGPALVLLVLWGWRREGGRPAVRERNRAVRTGRLPPSADATWLPRLRARAESLAQWRWLFPLLVVTQLFVAISQLMRSSGIYSTIFWVGDVLLFVTMGIYGAAVYPARTRNLERLMDQLRSRESSTQ